MKAVKISQLQEGACLSKDIYNDLGNIILSKGTTVEKEHINYLAKHHVEYVYIENASQEADESREKYVLKDDKYRLVNDSYDKTTKRFKKIYFSLEDDALDASDFEALKEDVVELVDVITKDNNLLESLRYVTHQDDYNFRHAVNVGIISAMIGKWLKLPYDDIVTLGFAGILHDIGKCAISSDVLEKTGPITLNERKILQDHVNQGYSLLKNLNMFEPIILSCVLFHHERLDGSGYPRGLKGQEIPYFAKIVAVADVFDAITSNRSYKSAVSAYSAFKTIRAESFNGLDPHVSDIFLENIATHFVNNRVKLTNGKLGNVVYVNKYILNRPLIRTDEDEYIDLSTDYSIDIECVLPY